MKWKFTALVVLVTAFIALNGKHVVGQQIPILSQPYQQPSYYQQTPSPPSFQPQFHQNGPMPNHDPISMRQRKNFPFIIKKDGTLERIEKEPGVPFMPEEAQQGMEAREKLQSAVQLMKSPDADEAKKKEAKLLIAKYLKAEFQWDQDGRREQVERLEKQVVELKKQLSRREESQDKLIELRIQLMENDAAGLSFPESWSNIASGGTNGPPPAYGPPHGPQSFPQYTSPNVSGSGMIYRPSEPQNAPIQPNTNPNSSQPPKR